MNNILRQHAEQQTAEELHELKQQETHPVPDNWQLSPQSVVTYLISGTLKNGFTVKPKYIGNRRLMEIAVATLATDRALLLYGLPGTAKSWVSEHIAAAVSGDSTLVVQGTAGTGEEAIRYGWNYARLLAEGPSEKALVETPVMRAMKEGKIGIQPALEIKAPQVYPNPFKDEFFVKNVESGAYEIYDFSGRRVANGNLTDGKVNASSLLKGVYMVKIINTNGTETTMKIVKQ